MIVFEASQPIKLKTMKQMTEKSQLGQTAKRERQRILSTILESSTIDFFERINLNDGSKCLHMGCNDGEATLQMASILGDKCSIIGIDNSEYNIEIARQKISSGNGSKVSFLLNSSFERTNTKKYDLIYSRFLLSTVSNPMKALQKMFRLLKPQGLLLAEDIDFSNLFCSPYSSAFERYKELYSRFIQNTGADSNIGSSLQSKLTNIGFQQVKTQLVPPSFLTEESKKLSSLTLEMISSPVIKAKIVLPAEIQALLYELKDLEQQPYSMISLPGIYQVAAIKPLIKHPA